MRCLLAVGVLVATAPVFAAGRPMTIDDLLAVKGVSDPSFSPDGKQIVYVVTELDRATEKSTSSLWLVPAAGGEPRRLTTAPGVNNHPRFAPDGNSIAFVSNRGGSAQIWILPLGGGEAKALTTLAIDLGGPLWSPKGDRLVATGEVYPGLSPAETAARDKEKETAKSKARAYDHLMVRHWNAWDEGKRSHLFVIDATTGQAHDITPQLTTNVPPAPFGGSSDYAWSPDGQEIAFSTEPAVNHAWSTNTDVWVVPALGGAPKNITAGNPGADAQPLYSPDGRTIAVLSQSRAGFESDLWVLRLIDRGTLAAREISRTLDRPIQSIAWHPQGDRVLATIDDDGGVAIVAISTAPGDPPRVDRVMNGGVHQGLVVSSQGKLAFTRTTAGRPAELHATNHPLEFYTARNRSESQAPLTRQNQPRVESLDLPLTKHNDPLVDSLDLPRLERFRFAGADGDPVQGWLLRPPGFDPSRKYPVLFLIHGGPQGAWHDEWHGRWNYELIAAPGYAVVAINPRGSTGYGQKFTDQISKDWTGKVYTDLMKGLDHALGTYTFLDGTRVAALGGSYGGFMVNWIAGHSDRFKALVSHAGVFDLTSKYGSTEELWFPEWEFGGTPWEQPEHYRERSPSLFAGHFKTPTLVIHGALDFRVPDAQGLGMFTALKRRGVPSRYLWFPDEGHWITRPANRVKWWSEIFTWLDRWLKA